MYEVDARGLSCPEPVMLTSQALKSHGKETIKVLVSEPHTRANVEKFAKSQGRTVTVTEKGDEFELVIQ
jgi:tRNA 2-thiouridine synthesizing protein A